MTAKVVATAYASGDFAAMVATLPQPDTTAVIERRLTRSWPAFGGCGSLITRWLAAQGISAELVTWVGDDDLGRRYLERLKRSGVGTAGVVVAPGARTGTSHLFYAATGEAVNFYDGGGANRDEATEAQLALARDADWLCLTPAPHGVNAMLLEAASPDTQVSWVVTADPLCFPPDFVRRMLARSTLVTFSRGERSFICDAVGSERPPVPLEGRGIAVETHGREGVRLITAEGENFLPVEPVDVADTTGAGDIFHAGMLAQLIWASRGDEPPVGGDPRVRASASEPPGGEDPLAASRAGVAAAREFLLDGSWRSL